MTRVRHLEIIAPIRTIQPKKPDSTDALEEIQDRFADQHAEHARWLNQTYGDKDYPTALAAIMRSAGRPRFPVRGRQAWAIVDRCDPEAGRYLRSLGTNPDAWKNTQREVKQATIKAATAARKAMRSGQKEKASRLMRLSSAAEAAAYLAKTKWHQRAQLAAADLVNVDDLVPDDPVSDEQDGGAVTILTPAGAMR